MTTKIKYEKAPKEVEQSLERAKIIPNFELTPEEVARYSANKSKKIISIYLSEKTIAKFKELAQNENKRYQTMISDVLDTYTEQLG